MHTEGARSTSFLPGASTMGAAGEASRRFSSSDKRHSFPAASTSGTITAKGLASRSFSLRRRLTAASEEASRQQLKAAHAQQSHDQAVRQHPRHLFRGSVKPVAEPQFGTI